MAYNESGEIPVSQSTYSLGGYTFELKVQNVHEPGEEEVVSVFAICRGPDGTRETQALDFPAEITVKSWCVEANQTEASVYAQIEGGVNAAIGTASIPLDNGWYSCDIAPRIALPSAGDTIYLTQYENRLYFGGYGGRMSVLQYDPPAPYGWYFTVGYSERFGYLGFDVALIGADIPEAESNPAGKSIKSVIESGEYLIGRFAIDIREADPEDWDEPGDTGDPSYTLNVYVTGASAGTHNSDNVPLDGEIQSVYGSGGNGGNGGGGGAGASTVIIYEFATDKAGSVNQEAYAREAGAGGPGGPGGRGADGCIIIFY